MGTMTPKQVVDRFKKAGCESLSGPGSSYAATIQARSFIQETLNDQRYGIKTVFDAPCGDWNWMQHVDLSNVRYVGLDIVDTIIKENKKKHGHRNNVIFHTGDITTFDIGIIDLFICRDFMFHVSFETSLKILTRYKYRYLIAPSWSNTVNVYDFKGYHYEHREINLEMPPFNLEVLSYIKEIHPSCQCRKLYLFKGNI